MRWLPHAAPSPANGSELEAAVSPLASTGDRRPAEAGAEPMPRAEPQVEVAQPDQSPAVEELEPPPLPLVFRTQALSSMNLDEEQVAAIVTLQREFTEALGPTPDPRDPAYRERWQAAQPWVDEQLAEIIGRQGVIELDGLAEDPSPGDAAKQPD